MQDGFIDIHNYEEKYQQALSRFDVNPAISQHNKDIVRRFLRDASLGKTVINRAKKKIKASRLHGYLKHLTIYLLFVEKSLDDVTQEDMEFFVEALERNQILSREEQFRGNKTKAAVRRPLSDRYKTDIKVSVRKFYKWLWGNNRMYPPLVEWIDTSCKERQIPALTEREVERMIDLSNHVVNRAIIQVLFDSGFRLGELMNIRLKHVRFRPVDASAPTRRCFFLHVPFSKTYPRTVACPMPATTKHLTLWLEQHPARASLAADGVVESPNVEAQLFPYRKEKIVSVLRRAGHVALGKRVGPQVMRHTSATYWSNRLPPYKLCRRMGWTMTSKMAQRYIDVEGVDQVEFAATFLKDKEMEELKARKRMSLVASKTIS